MRDFVRIQAFVFCCFLGGLAGAALSLATLGGGQWSGIEPTILGRTSVGCSLSRICASEARLGPSSVRWPGGRSSAGLLVLGRSSFRQAQPPNLEVGALRCMASTGSERTGPRVSSLSHTFLEDRS